MAAAPSDAIKVLLIEDDPQYAQRLVKLFYEAFDPSFSVELCSSLQPGLDRLAKPGIDVVVLDLVLPDSEGLDTFSKVHTQAPDVPIVVSTMIDNDAIAVEAVRKGAQDYLVKGQIDGKALSRVLRYAIERQRMQETLRGLALLDELTGLYNRRGFVSLADHHLKLARRTKRGLMLVLADLDGLKRINDTFGHPEGDTALVKAADVLRQAFRASDVIARIGGDEFAVLAIQANKDSPEILRSRITDQLGAYNAQASRGYVLALSAGTVYFDPEQPLSIDELLARADTELYAQKRGKRAGI